jgi:hypothetical protein
MSRESEFLAFLIPTVVGVIVAIFSVRFSEWTLRRRFSELEVSLSVKRSEPELTLLELAFTNIGKHEIRDCRAELVGLEDRLHSKLVLHEPLNWSYNVTGDFDRTMFPNQTGYIEILGARKRYTISDFPNQITHSAFVDPGTNNGAVTIELSWHSGQMSRIILKYAWGPNPGTPMIEARIAAAADVSFKWRMRLNWHSVRIGAAN